MAKLSSQDFVLNPLFNTKIKGDQSCILAKLIDEADRLNAAEAYIATGSNNTARYFEYYFAKKPHIIRKNRTSVGLIDG